MPSFTNAGTYTVSYSISKNYYETETGTVTLVIEPKSLTAFTVAWDKLSYVYDGTAKKPIPTIKDPAKNYTLVNGKDYIVTYKDNIMPNSATNTPTATIEGIGNYKGKISKEFTIEKGTIVYTVINGEGQYSGYEQSGSTTKAEVKVTAPAGYDLQYSVVAPYCEASRPGCSVDEKIYDSGYNVPKFKNVGTHNVYFRIKATGYETITGTVSITITRAKLEKPVLFENLIYTGRVQTPIFRNYNSKFMKATGSVKATEPGTYITTFKLIDNNVDWKDNTRTD